GEIGFNEATIAATTSGAGVSSRTFYSYFATLEDCYLGALDEALARIGPALLEAFESETEWPRAIRKALAALLGMLADDPATARTLPAATFVAVSKIAERYRSAFDHLVPYLRQGRGIRESNAAPLPDSTELAVLGAANSLIGRHAFRDAAEDLPALLADLV